MKPTLTARTSVTLIERRILIIRGARVMIDADLRALWRTDQSAEPSRFEESATLSRGLHVPTNIEGSGKLEVTICDFKF